MAQKIAPATVGGAQEPPDSFAPEEERELDDLYRKAAQEDLPKRDAPTVLEGIISTMAAHPPLSHEENLALAVKVQAGNQAELTLAGAEHKDASERIRLKALIREGRAAKNRLVIHNLRLVFSIARRRQRQDSHLMLEDLFQEGTIGLARGIDTFDTTRGFKLSTYVTWWVRSAMGRLIHNQERTIRIPVHSRDMIARANRIIKKSAGRDRPLSMEEALQTAGSSPAQIRWLQKSAALSKELSIDTPIGPDDERSFGEFLTAATAVSAEDGQSQKDELGKLAAALRLLRPRERYVLVGHYLGGGTLASVGAKLGLTRERVRQIEVRALLRLRSILPTLRTAVSISPQDFHREFLNISPQNSRRKFLNQSAPNLAERIGDRKMWELLAKWRATGTATTYQGRPATRVRSQDIPMPYQNEMKKRGWIVPGQYKGEWLIVVNNEKARAWYHRNRKGGLRRSRRLVAKSS